MFKNFSTLLKEIRTNSGLKQIQYAKLLGCEPSYLSALERGKKEPPKSEKLEAMIKRMGLTETQAEQLRVAAEFRISNIKIPKDSSDVVREMCVRLNKQLPKISNFQAKVINQVLSPDQEESKM